MSTMTRRLVASLALLTTSVLGENEEKAKGDNLNPDEVNEVTVVVTDAISSSKGSNAIQEAIEEEQTSDMDIVIVPDADYESTVAASNSPPTSTTTTTTTPVSVQNVVQKVQKTGSFEIPVTRRFKKTPSYGKRSRRVSFEGGYFGWIRE